MTDHQSGPQMTRLEELDFQQPAVLECPYPSYERLRSQCPVFRTLQGYWLVTRYDDVVHVLLDTGRFSGHVPPSPDAELQAVLAGGYPEIPTLLAADPPNHGRYRTLAKKAFLPGRVRQLDAQIAVIADELIDRWVDDGHVELIGQFAVGLPLTVIADALGVDRCDLALFKQWSDDIVAPRSGPLSHDELLDAARSLVDMQHYMAARCEQRRADPQDDLLTDLVQARFDDGDRVGEPLSLNESIGIIRQLLVAGNETTTSLTANVMLALVQDPSLMADIRADGERLDAVIEEMLRVDAPIQMLPRRAVVDVRIGATDIRAGDIVYVVYASANHDEQYFEDAAQFDPRRTSAKPHLAFGKGAHFCIGAALARSEARIAFERLLARTEEWQLDPQSTAPVRRGLSMQLRGLSGLDLVFTRRG